MDVQTMKYSLRGLVQAAVATVRNPRDGARAVLAQDLPGLVLWQALILVVAVSVILGQGTLMLTLDGGVEAFPMLFSPLALGGIQLGLLVVMVYAMHVIGRAMGGQGAFAGSIALVVWLQFIMVCLQVVQSGLMFVLPPAADVVGIMGLALFMWLLTNFVAVLHGFQHLGLVFVMILMSAFGIAFALSLVLTLLGISGFGDMNV